MSFDSVSEHYGLERDVCFLGIEDILNGMALDRLAVIDCRRRERQIVLTELLFAYLQGARY